jgi:hypothetical protein
VNGDTVRTRAIRPNGTEFDTLLLVPTGIGGAPGRMSGAPAALSSVSSPSSGLIRVSFTLPAPGQADLLLYDQTGRQAARLAGGHFAAGEHWVSWDGTGLEAGTYFLVLESAGGADTQRLVIIGKD